VARGNTTMTRSGTSTTPNAARKRKMVTITLSPEALERIDAYAWKRGTSRSGVIEALSLRLKTG
jgi:Ribbon-helix-helix protein, copG family